MIPYQLITFVVIAVALCVCSLLLGSLILWSLREELTMFGVLFSVFAYSPAVMVISAWLGGPVHGPFGFIYFLMASTVIAIMFPLDQRSKEEQR